MVRSVSAEVRKTASVMREMTPFQNRCVKAKFGNAGPGGLSKHFAFSFPFFISR
jgi:hypothetical protein